MKRIAVVLCVLFMLTGCAGTEQQLGRAMALREKLLSASGCSFDAVVTADYGDVTYTFSMNCRGDDQGNLQFAVVEPQTIAGISGTVSSTGGKLTFDDKALTFGLMAEGLVTPVSAPWLFLKTLRSGYLTSCGKEGNYLRLSIDDSYEEDALHLDIWLGEGDLPVQSDIYWQGCRLLSIQVENFTFL